MANGQPNPPRKNPWISFFMGSPQRFTFWALVALLGFAAAFPELARQGISNALYAITTATAPYVTQLIMLAIAVGGIYIIIQPLLPKKKKKKDGGH